MLELCAVGYDHPHAAVLIAAVQREYVNRYGGEDSTPVEHAEFAPPRGHFVVGYVAGQPVACGGWRAHEAPDRLRRRSASGATAIPDDFPYGALQFGDAEVKRMFVVTEHRGRGHARAVLAELERTAAAAGHRRVVLETGTRQPEAITLYAGSGYTPIAPFGTYRDSPNCRCFAKIVRHPRGNLEISSGATGATGEGCDR